VVTRENIPKIKSNEQKNKIFQILELLLVIPLTLPFVVVFLTPNNTYFGWNLVEWFRFMIILPLGALIMIPVISYYLGTSDYRFKILLHSTLLAVLVSLLVFMAIGIDVFNPNAKLLNSMLSFGSILLIITPPAIGIIMTLFSETNTHLVEVNRVMEVAINGDYTIQISKPKTLSDSVFGPIADTLNSLIHTTHLLLENNMSTIDDINQSSKIVSDNTNLILTSTEEVTSTVESMADTLNLQSERITSLYGVTTNLNETIKGIVDQIQTNASIVSNISLQTSVLALNAGIEASRAGDYGRGFAVVAENVRKLSEDTKKAVNQISEVSVTISELLQSSFYRTSELVNELQAMAEESSASAEEITAATEEIANSISDLSVSSDKLHDRASKSIEELMVAGLRKYFSKTKVEPLQSI